MPQVPEVTQFVDGFLEGPLPEKLRVAGLAEEFRLEAGQGDDGAFLMGVGKTEDEIKVCHIEVNHGYS